MQSLPQRLALAVMVVGFSFPTSFAQFSSHKIDAGIRAGRPDYDKVASPRATDAEFVRRIYLDLAGTIPSASEAKAFLNDRDEQRREKLVDRLLARDSFARQMQTVFDLLFMDRRPGKNVKASDWQEFLRKSFAENNPYDRLVTEILSADGVDAKTRPSARFYLDREGEPHQITKDISRLFLGMNLACAQCHDHPLVNAYKQDHYFGVYAFLNRSYLFTEKTTKQVVFAEKAEGDVSFESVFVAKVKKSTGPRLPGTKELPEPKFESGKEYVEPVKKGERGIPKHSRRSQLAKAVVEHPQFARSAVNRLWSVYFGRGIVHPIEWDHPENPPSHPQLLDALSEEFRQQKFDLKALVRALVLSEAYQRSSEVRAGDPVDAKFFASASLRPMMPEQLAWSVLEATGFLEAERRALGAKASDSTLASKVANTQATFERLFGTQAGDPALNQDFEATLDQTLFLNNGDALRGFLSPRPGNLTDRLTSLKDSKEIANELYLSVLTRMPNEEESREVADFLQRRPSERLATLQDLAWALLTSAEFRFNH